MRPEFRGKKKIAIGMAHPIALPGSYRHNGERIDAITEQLLEEIVLFDKYGYDGVILQNFSDIPLRQLASVETAAYLTHLAEAIKRELPQQILGILAIWDGCTSLAVADAAGADFARVEHVYMGAEVTTTGIIEGQCADILMMKKRLGSKIPIYADIYEPHADPICPKPIEDAAFDAVCQCFADGLFLSGHSAEESIRMAQKARTRVGDVPIILGGGSTGETVYRLLQEFDGVCIGSWIKDGNLLNPVNPERAKRYMDEVARARM